MNQQLLREGINHIADQLCRAVDKDFTFRVQTQSSDVDLQKLSVLTNFLLESVEENLKSLEQNRHELEERVLERTKRLDLIVKGAGVGIWEWDPVADVVNVSTQWMGAEARGPVDHTFDLDYWLSQIHSADVGKFKKALHLHLSGVSERFQAEYRLADGAGGYRWILCRGVCDRHPKTGQPTWMSGTVSDITKARFHDKDTGLVNSQYFELIVDEKLRRGEPMSVVLLNIANRGLVVENLSRHEIQSMIETVVERLMTKVDHHSLLGLVSVGLYGFVLPFSDQRQLADFSRELISLFDEPFSIGEQRLWLTCHVGACDLVDIQAMNAEDALYAAQLALRDMRSNQGSDFRLFEDSMRESSLDRLDTEQMLRMALRHDWVKIRLQPIVNFEDGVISGYEALARIEHPKKGIISPARFIPVAEETGLIRQISEVVMKQAVALAADERLKVLHPSGFTMGVNLSPLQLHDPGLPDRIAAMLAEKGVEPARFKLEMTESAVMADQKSAIDILTRLRQLGMRVALDDFGTGYSSLAYLRQLPLDILKVDRSLVSGLDSHPDKYAILEMVIGLSAKLGLKVVVEGIETEQELLQVIALGAQNGQGFLFAKPITVEELPDAHQHVATIFANMK
ncbi:EAL domain-containing protein [Gallaecimonas mangrovi]|uniref:EAL domain-containing protein n=1 Tax=Gallaecimonas mangrovi TaxID=2291597 RepID=UPI000E20BC43|nr:EAL domain-containing protein [Gallaecimonas mangrovi]